MSNDPHDHRTSPPATPERSSLLPAACPECGAALIVHRRINVEMVKREGGRPLPIGDRTDTFTATCPQHGLIDGVAAITPAGEPLSSVVDRVLAPLVAPEPRWHEIATDGLPAESGTYFVYLGTPTGEFTECVDIADFERDETFERLGLKRTWSWSSEGTACCAHYLSDDLAASITHWMPCPLPAPPTKEPR